MLLATSKKIFVGQQCVCGGITSDS